MKHFAKVAVGIAVAASVAASAGALYGCSSGDAGEAYGLTHGGSYVGYAKIVTSGDKVKDLTLTEVCLPDHVCYTATSTESFEAAKAALGEHNTQDFVIFKSQSSSGGTTTYKATAYYGVVKYGDVTVKYDEATDGYVVQNENKDKFADFLQSEENCKAYYEAVTSGNIKVTVGGEDKTGVMNAAALSKEENGYWTRKDRGGNDYSRWKMNRDATVKFVKENGVEALKNLTKADKESDDVKEDKKVTYWMSGSVSTNATWVDLNSDTSGENYFSYAQLILKAKSASGK